MNEERLSLYPFGHDLAELDAVRTENDGLHRTLADYADMATDLDGEQNENATLQQQLSEACELIGELRAALLDAINGEGTATTKVLLVGKRLSFEGGAG